MTICSNISFFDSCMWQKKRHFEYTRIPFWTHDLKALEHHSLRPSWDNTRRRKLHATLKTRVKRGIFDGQNGVLYGALHGDLWFFSPVMIHPNFAVVTKAWSIKSHAEKSVSRLLISKILCSVHSCISLYELLKIAVAQKASVALFCNTPISNLLLQKVNSRDKKPD